MAELTTPESGKKPSWLSIAYLVIGGLGFVGGHYTAILTDWNTRSTQLDQVIKQQQDLSKDFKDFMVGYVASHETVNGSLIEIRAEQQRIEDHLTHNDSRLDRIEAGRR